MKKMQALYSKLFWVRPSQLGKLFDSDPAPIVEATLVDQIGSFLTTLRDYVVRAEVVGGSLEVREGELRERRNSSDWSRLSSKGRWLGLNVELGLVLFLFWVSLC